MRKSIWMLLFIAIILGAAFWSAGGYKIKDEAPYYLKDFIGETATVKIGDNEFMVEVARTAKARARGLSGRESLSGERGMLFEFPVKDIYAFTMKDTLIPLDIIWILEEEIVYLVKDAQPDTEEIKPSVEANYVLEVNSGIAARYQWDVGHRVEITFDK